MNEESESESAVCTEDSKEVVAGRREIVRKSLQEGVELYSLEIRISMKCPRIELMNCDKGLTRHAAC